MTKRRGRPADDLKNKTYGLLSVIERVGSNKHGHATWLCVCACGSQSIVTASNLKCGLVSTCGCGKGYSHTEIRSKY